MPLSPVDALFIATSAVCVTGLSVVDISKDVGLVSQIVLIALVQIGGLGIMTMVMFLSLTARRRIGIKGRMYFLGGLGVDGLHGAVRLFFTVIKYTLVIEGVGALLLLSGFLLDGESLTRSVYLAVFHSVSCFCNAGFSPCSGGLQGYQAAFIIPGAAMLLLVLGGIGFPVVADCAACWADRRKILSVYSKLVVVMTGGLIVGGAFLLLLSDWNVALAGMPVWNKIWNALFMSVSTRTAGFDIVAPGAFSGLGQAVMVVLMLIGSSPASTGGGVKTTTFGVLAVSVWSELHRRRESTFFSRNISAATERRALSIVAIYIMTLLLGTILLSFTEKTQYSAILFEAASALATTGLSVGITPDLSVLGKLIVTTLMFLGRVGLYTFISTLITADSGPEICYPETHVPIG